MKCYNIKGYKASAGKWIRIDWCLMADKDVMGQRAFFCAVKLYDVPWDRIYGLKTQFSQNAVIYLSDPKAVGC